MIALKDDDNANDNDNIIDGWWFCEAKENRGSHYLPVLYATLATSKKCFLAKAQ